MPKSSSRLILRLLVAASFFVLSSASRMAFAADSYDIAVVTSLSGSAAMLGQTGKEALGLAERVINQGGGVQGRPVHFAFYDDETSPQVAVQLASQIKATNPPVILGASLAAQCNAMSPLMQDGPVMYCLSPAPQVTPGTYAFESFVSSDAIIQTLVRYFKARGWTRLGLVTTTDATGQDADRAFAALLKLDEFKGVTIVDQEHFNAADVSVSAPIEKLRAAKPQILVAFTTGAAIGTVFRSLAQAGLDIPVATSTGNEIFSLMNQYRQFLPKELYFGSGAGSANGSDLVLGQGTIAAKAAFNEAYKTADRVPDFGAEVVWDPAMIVVHALRSLGTEAQASKVRDFISHLDGYEGVSGTYNFGKYPQRGLGSDNVIIVRWNDAKAMFEAVSQTGGQPIVAKN